MSLDPVLARRALAGGRSLFLLLRFSFPAYMDGVLVSAGYEGPGHFRSSLVDAQVLIITVFRHSAHPGTDEARIALAIIRELLNDLEAKLRANMPELFPLMDQSTIPTSAMIPMTPPTMYQMYFAM